MSTCAGFMLIDPAPWFLGDVAPARHYGSRIWPELCQARRCDRCGGSFPGERLVLRAAHYKP
ncbi:MAG: hypothetical protein ACRDSN_20230, partial [Pseudonocardiaceae bacterium]